MAKSNSKKNNSRDFSISNTNVFSDTFLNNTDDQTKSIIDKYISELHENNKSLKALEVRLANRYEECKEDRLNKISEELYSNDLSQIRNGIPNYAQLKNEHIIVSKKIALIDKYFEEFDDNKKKLINLWVHRSINNDSQFKAFISNLIDKKPLTMNNEQDHSGLINTLFQTMAEIHHMDNEQVNKKIAEISGFDVNPEIAQQYGLQDQNFSEKNHFNGHAFNDLLYIKDKILPKIEQFPTSTPGVSKPKKYFDKFIYKVKSVLGFASNQNQVQKNWASNIRETKQQLAEAMVKQTLEELNSPQIQLGQTDDFKTQRNKTADFLKKHGQFVILSKDAKNFNLQLLKDVTLFLKSESNNPKETASYDKVLSQLSTDDFKQLKILAPKNSLGKKILDTYNDAIKAIKKSQSLTVNKKTLKLSPGDKHLFKLYLTRQINEKEKDIIPNQSFFTRVKNQLSNTFNKVKAFFKPQYVSSNKNNLNQLQSYKALLEKLNDHKDKNKALDLEDLTTNEYVYLYSLIDNYNKHAKENYPNDKKSIDALHSLDTLAVRFNNATSDKAIKNQAKQTVFDIDIIHKGNNRTNINEKTALLQKIRILKSVIDKADEFEALDVLENIITGRKVAWPTEQQTKDIRTFFEFADSHINFILTKFIKKHISLLINEDIRSHPDEKKDFDIKGIIALVNSEDENLPEDLKNSNEFKDIKQKYVTPYFNAIQNIRNTIEQRENYTSQSFQDNDIQVIKDLQPLLGESAKASIDNILQEACQGIGKTFTLTCNYYSKDPVQNNQNNNQRRIILYNDESGELIARSYFADNNKSLEYNLFDIKALASEFGYKEHVDALNAIKKQYDKIGKITDENCNKLIDVIDNYINWLPKLRENLKIIDGREKKITPIAKQIVVSEKNDQKITLLFRLFETAHYYEVEIEKNNKINCFMHMPRDNVTLIEDDYIRVDDLIHQSYADLFKDEDSKKNAKGLFSRLSQFDEDAVKQIKDLVFELWSKPHQKNYNGIDKDGIDKDGFDNKDLDAFYLFAEGDLRKDYIQQYIDYKFDVKNLLKFNTATHTFADNSGKPYELRYILEEKEYLKTKINSLIEFIGSDELLIASDLTTIERAVKNIPILLNKVASPEDLARFRLKVSEQCFTKGCFFYAIRHKAPSKEAQAIVAKQGNIINSDNLSDENNDQHVVKTEFLCTLFKNDSRFNDNVENPEQKTISLHDLIGSIENNDSLKESKSQLDETILNAATDFSERANWTSEQELLILHVLSPESLAQYYTALIEKQIETNPHDYKNILSIKAFLSGESKSYCLLDKEMGAYTDNTAPISINADYVVKKQLPLVNALINIDDYIEEITHNTQSQSFEELDIDNLDNLVMLSNGGNDEGSIEIEVQELEEITDIAIKKEIPGNSEPEEEPSVEIEVSSENEPKNAPPIEIAVETKSEETQAKKEPKSRKINPSIKMEVKPQSEKNKDPRIKVITQQNNAPKKENKLEIINSNPVKSDNNKKYKQEKHHHTPMDKDSWMKAYIKWLKQAIENRAEPSKVQLLCLHMDKIVSTFNKAFKNKFKQKIHEEIFKQYIDKDNKIIFSEAPPYKHHEQMEIIASYLADDESLAKLRAKNISYYLKDVSNNKTNSLDALYDYIKFSDTNPLVNKRNVDNSILSQMNYYIDDSYQENYLHSEQLEKFLARFATDEKLYQCRVNRINELFLSIDNTDNTQFFEAYFNFVNSFKYPANDSINQNEVSVKKLRTAFALEKFKPYFDNAISNIGDKRNWRVIVNYLAFAERFFSDDVLIYLYKRSLQALIGFYNKRINVSQVSDQDISIYTKVKSSICSLGNNSRLWGASKTTLFDSVPECEGTLQNILMKKSQCFHNNLTDGIDIYLTFASDKVLRRFLRTQCILTFHDVSNLNMPFDEYNSRLKLVVDALNNQKNKQSRVNHQLEYFDQKFFKGDKTLQGKVLGSEKNVTDSKEEFFDSIEKLEHYLNNNKLTSIFDNNKDKTIKKSLLYLAHFGTSVVKIGNNNRSNFKVFNEIIVEKLLFHDFKTADNNEKLSRFLYDYCEVYKKIKDELIDKSTVYLDDIFNKLLNDTHYEITDERKKLINTFASNGIHGKMLYASFIRAFEESHPNNEENATFKPNEAVSKVIEDYHATGKDFPCYSININQFIENQADARHSLNRATLIAAFGTDEQVAEFESKKIKFFLSQAQKPKNQGTIDSQAQKPKNQKTNDFQQYYQSYIAFRVNPYNMNAQSDTAINLGREIKNSTVLKKVFEQELEKLKKLPSEEIEKRINEDVITIVKDFGNDQLAADYLRLKLASFIANADTKSASKITKFLRRIDDLKIPLLKIREDKDVINGFQALLEKIDKDSPKHLELLFIRYAGNTQLDNYRIKQLKERYVDWKFEFDYKQRFLSELNQSFIGNPQFEKEYREHINNPNKEGLSSLQESFKQFVNRFFDDFNLFNDDIDSSDRARWVIEKKKILKGFLISWSNNLSESSPSLYDTSLYDFINEELTSDFSPVEKTLDDIFDENITINQYRCSPRPATNLLGTLNPLTTGKKVNADSLFWGTDNIDKIPIGVRIKELSNWNYLDESVAKYFCSDKTLDLLRIKRLQHLLQSDNATLTQYHINQLAKQENVGLNEDLWSFVETEEAQDIVDKLLKKALDTAFSPNILLLIENFASQSLKQQARTRRLTDIFNETETAWDLSEDIPTIAHFKAPPLEFLNKNDFHITCSDESEYEKLQVLQDFQKLEAYIGEENLPIFYKSLENYFTRYKTNHMHLFDGNNATSELFKLLITEVLGNSCSDEDNKFNNLYHAYKHEAAEYTNKENSKLAYREVVNAIENYDLIQANKIYKFYFCKDDSYRQIKQDAIDNDNTEDLLKELNSLSAKLDNHNSEVNELRAGKDDYSDYIDRKNKDRRLIEEKITEKTLELIQFANSRNFEEIIEQLNNNKPIDKLSLYSEKFRYCVQLFKGNESLIDEFKIKNPDAKLTPLAEFILRYSLSDEEKIINLTKKEKTINLAKKALKVGNAKQKNDLMLESLIIASYRVAREMLAPLKNDNTDILLPIQDHCQTYLKEVLSQSNYSLCSSEVVAHPFSVPPVCDSLTYLENCLVNLLNNILKSLPEDQKYLLNKINLRELFKHSDSPDIEYLKKIIKDYLVIDKETIDEGKKCTNLKKMLGFLLSRLIYMKQKNAFKAKHDKDKLIMLYEIARVVPKTKIESVQFLTQEKDAMLSLINTINEMSKAFSSTKATKHRKIIAYAVEKFNKGIIIETQKAVDLVKRIYLNFYSANLTQLISSEVMHNILVNKNYIKEQLEAENGFIESEFDRFFAMLARRLEPLYDDVTMQLAEYFELFNDFANNFLMLFQGSDINNDKLAKIDNLIKKIQYFERDSVYIQENDLSYLRAKLEKLTGDKFEPYFNDSLDDLDAFKKILFNCRQIIEAVNLVRRIYLNSDNANSTQFISSEVMHKILVNKNYIKEQLEDENNFNESKFDGFFDNLAMRLEPLYADETMQLDEYFELFTNFANNFLMLFQDSDINNDKLAKIDNLINQIQDFERDSVYIQENDLSYLRAKLEKLTSDKLEPYFNDSLDDLDAFKKILYLQKSINTPYDETQSDETQKVFTDNSTLLFFNQGQNSCAKEADNCIPNVPQNAIL